MFFNANNLDLSKSKYFKEKLRKIINWKKFESYKNEINKKEYLCSSLLIYKILKSTKIPVSKLVRKENKKPYIKNNQFYFSISHSRGLVCMAYDTYPVGCDIEVKNYSFKCDQIYKKYFSKKECLYISKSKNIKDEFYKIWSCKESLKKASNFSKLTLNKPSIQFKGNWKTKLNNQNYYFYFKKINSQCLVVCSTCKNIRIKIVRLNKSDLSIL